MVLLTEQFYIMCICARQVAKLLYALWRWIRHSACPAVHLTRRIMFLMGVFYWANWSQWDTCKATHQYSRGVMRAPLSFSLSETPKCQLSSNAPVNTHTALGRMNAFISIRTREHSYMCARTHFWQLERRISRSPPWLLICFCDVMWWLLL